MTEPSWADRPWEEEAPTSSQGPDEPSNANSTGCGGCLLWLFGISLVLTLAGYGISALLDALDSSDQRTSSTTTSSAPSVAREAGGCASAVDRAAAVPPNESNDAEFAATLASCDDYDEWARAVLARPEVIGLESLTEAELRWALEAGCASATTAPVCVDARALGIIP